jgi:hypothetical protein
MQEIAAMTMRAETRSPAGVLLITCSIESDSTCADLAVNASNAPVLCGEGLSRQNDGRHSAEAAASPMQDMFIVLGITVGNLGFVASVALAIGWYAP